MKHRNLHKKYGNKIQKREQPIITKEQPLTKEEADSLAGSALKQLQKTESKSESKP